MTLACRALGRACLWSLGYRLLHSRARRAECAAAEADDPAERRSQCERFVQLHARLHLPGLQLRDIEGCLRRQKDYSSLPRDL